MEQVVLFASEADEIFINLMAVLIGVPLLVVIVALGLTAWAGLKGNH